MAKRVRYDRLLTEQPHPRSRNLDRLPTLRLLRLMNREDVRTVRAVARRLPQIARATRVITQALRRGRRLIFVGAGTSGRLGVLEAAECPPTFHTEPSLVQAIIAGGERAVFRSREGAEDRRSDARAAVRRRVRRGDVVVGVSASGVTPFVDEALKVGRTRGARTILVTCHPRATMPADVRIALAVGPEVLAGSTRLKAGTAIKLILNMLTVGAMTALGKTSGNLMVEVRPTSHKLRARALRIIQVLTGLSERDATRSLRRAHNNVKAAILMNARDLGFETAKRQLAQAGGSLRRALRSVRHFPKREKYLTRLER